MLGKKQAKPLVPASYQGIFRCALPDNGDEFTMYPLGIPEWQNYPVSVFKARTGVYLIRGCPVSVEAVLLDQRPLTRKVWLYFRWRKFCDIFWQLVEGLD